MQNLQSLFWHVLQKCVDFFCYKIHTQMASFMDFLKFLLQISHLNGFFPLWIYKMFFPQISHLNGFFHGLIKVFVTIFCTWMASFLYEYKKRFFHKFPTWMASFMDFLKFLLQISHLNGFFPLWVYKTFFSTNFTLEWLLSWT
jgi:hypothetical protein